MFSAVVPAHNEAGVIDQCLQPLSAVAEKLGGEIFVVCNGCTDDTAAIAAQFVCVTVIESSIPSKTHALNCGDQAATLLPRLYFDADLRMSAEHIERLVRRLQVTQAMLVAPAMQLDLSQASVLSRWYHEFWTALPAYALRMGGVYGLTAKGRAAFDRFPDVTGDDAFVRALFTSDQVEIPADLMFACNAPRRVWELIKIRTRIVRGGRQIDRAFGASDDVPTNDLSSIAQLMRTSPGLCMKGIWFLAVTAAVKVRVKWLELRGAGIGWERDNSSRETIR